MLILLIHDSTISIHEMFIRKQKVDETMLLFSIEGPASNHYPKCFASTQ